MLTELEIEIIKESVQAAYLIPFIDDVEDFVWEAVWYETKGLLLNQRLARSKKLFDVVDTVTKIGWSAKTLVVPDTATNRQIEFVIQRADIIKKQEKLGFTGLSIEASPPQDLGNAVLTHWRNKVDEDAKLQQVTDQRLAILLKSKSLTSFAVIEDVLAVPSNDEISWFWTDANTKVGLQGRNITNGLIQYRWYRNQTQLFERLAITDDAKRFEIDPKMLSLAELLLMMRTAGHMN